MKDVELHSIIKSIRDFVLDERNLNSNEKLDVYFLNMLEVSCSLTELGIVQERAITESEQYWFEGKYHLNFWNSNVEEDLYAPLVNEIKQRNWFR